MGHSDVTPDRSGNVRVQVACLYRLERLEGGVRLGLSIQKLE